MLLHSMTGVLKYASIFDDFVEISLCIGRLVS